MKRDCKRPASASEINNIQNSHEGETHPGYCNHSHQFVEEENGLKSVPTDK